MLEDHVDLFVADGQHRIANWVGWSKTPTCIRTKSQLFCCLLGIARSKQIFSDLNLTAKPISKSLGYSFEREPKVLLTIAVTDNVLVFNGRVNKKTNNLSARSKDVVTLSTLVNSNLEIMSAIYGKSEKQLATDDKWRALWKLKPNHPDLIAAAAPLIEYWNIFTSNTPGWDKLGQEDGLTAGQMRDGTDAHLGYVNAFGVGVQAAANAYAALIRDRDEAEAKKLIQLCLSNVNWEKGKHWDGLAMVGSRMNNTGPGIKASAGYILHAGGVIPVAVMTRTRPSSRCSCKCRTPGVCINQQLGRNAPTTNNVTTIRGAGVAVKLKTELGSTLGVAQHIPFRCHNVC